MDKKEELAGSYLGKGVFFRGKINFQGEFLNDGNIEGSIKGERLLQGLEGKISGDVKTKEFSNEGFFRGDVACEVLRLKEGSNTEGNIEATEMTTEKGSRFVIQLKNVKPSSH